MAMAGDGRTSLVEGEKSRKRRFRPDISEEPQNSSGVPDQRVSSSGTVGILELEQMMKQMTFTRSEVQRLTTLLHSRICDDPVVELDAAVLPITPMASPQHPTTMENLPNDLLSNIFIRLLAKQLAQMRSVSKSLNALLSHPSFIKSHLHRSINNTDRILLVFYYYGELYFDPKPFTAIPCGSPHLELTNFIKLPPPNLESYGRGHGHRINVIGSVHGLICSHYNDDVIHIWNPSLSAVSTLPPSLCSRGRVISFRFGFDPSTDDYKVVKLSHHTGPRKRHNIFLMKEWLQVEIYSMRKGCWKLITERVPSHLSRILNREFVCVDGHDGHLHWLSSSAEKIEPQTIVVFDLVSETFSEMPLPDSVQDIKHSKSLGVLTGKLCVISCNKDDCAYEVWVMDEYGMADSWVKRHAFHFSHSLGDAIMGFTSHNEFIYKNTDGRLVLYDPIADKAKILDNSCPAMYGAYKVVEYIDSLVWVAPSVR